MGSATTAVRELLLRLGQRLNRAAWKEVPWPEARATLLGFAAAALVPAIVGGYSQCGLFDPTYSNQCDVGDWIGLSIVGYFFFCVPVTFVLAVPLYFITKWTVGVWWWSASIGGILVAMTLWLPLTLGSRDPYPVMARTIPLDALLIIAISASAGFIFWAIWRQGHSQ